MRIVSIVAGLIVGGLLAGMPAAHAAAEVDTPLVASTASLDFGSVAVGESRTLTVTLTHAGTSTFELGAIFYRTGPTNSPPEEFTIESMPFCGSDATMAPGDQCVFNVTFAPISTGSFSLPAGSCIRDGGFISVVPAGAARPDGSYLCDTGENFPLALSGVGVSPQGPSPAPVPPVTGPLTCAGLAATIVGTNDAELIAGTPGHDVIVALGGNDKVIGLGGNDVVCGGDGDDKLKGKAGTDHLFGEEGRDRLVGGPGKADLCRGGPGKDRARGCEIKSG